MGSKFKKATVELQCSTCNLTITTTRPGGMKRFLDVHFQHGGYVERTLPPYKKLPVEKDPQRFASLLQRAEIRKRDQARCRYCGLNLYGEVAACDHVIPWKKGGKTVIENLVLSCNYCNKKKGNKLIKPTPLGALFYTDPFKHREFLKSQLARLEK